MSAEAIGLVMRDFRRGSAVLSEPGDRHLVEYLAHADVIDIQPIHTVAKTESWMLYEDSVCRPPLENVAYAWENDHGNVLVWHVASTSRDDENWDLASGWASMADDHVIDWDLAQWVSTAVLWIGGYSDTRHEHIPTSGPLGMVYMAVNADGTVQDFRWLVAPEYAQIITEETLQDDLAILARALTFLNCRNVVVLEPLRERSERRRIERTGTTVKEIHITPVGQYRRRVGKTPVPLSAAGPLSNVRGHTARYGPRWGRGLLFGKYEGEFWIPGHTRGSAEHGETRHDYKVEA